MENNSTEFKNTRLKATDIIRRVDDLGRVVIPKEIRKTIKIAEGTPLEFYIMDEGIFLKPYTPKSIEIKTDKLESLINFATKGCDICQARNTCPFYQGKIDDGEGFSCYSYFLKWLKE
jgi:AbrB family looped-hinge helix DNA binding protein